MLLKGWIKALTEITRDTAFQISIDPTAIKDLPRCLHQIQIICFVGQCAIREDDLDDAESVVWFVRVSIIFPHLHPRPHDSSCNDEFSQKQSACHSRFE